MTILFEIVRVIKRLTRGIINRFWVLPLETILVMRLSVEKPNRIQSLLLRLFNWLANAGRILLDELYLSVIRWRGPDWSVTYIGNGFSAEALESILFSEPPDQLGDLNAYLWQVPGLVNRFIREGDLVVCELNQIIHLLPKKVDLFFTTPQWVKQVIDEVNRPLDEVKEKIHNALRRRACKLEAQGFTYEITHSELDFDLFYHRMYVPYIGTRHNCHGPIVRSYDYVHRSFEKGSLLLVKEGEAPVGGMIFEKTCESCLGVVMGIMDGRFDLVEQGTILALWWFLLTWANKNDVKRIEMGCSLPMTENGVFIHKRRWGARVFHDEELFTQWNFFGKNLPPICRAYLNKLGFISEISERHYQVMLLEPGQDIVESDLIARTRKIAPYGLDGVLVISPNGEKQLFPEPSPRSVSDRLPSPELQPVSPSITLKPVGSEVIP